MKPMISDAAGTTDTTNIADAAGMTNTTDETDDVRYG
jgi:hypothetical protein